MSAVASTSFSHEPDREEKSENDRLFEELEEAVDNDFDLSQFRERRLAELRAQMQVAEKTQDARCGQYTEFKAEKELIEASAQAPRSVIHFFHRDFRRCKIMDQHLETLAGKHCDTLFMKAEVSNVPFLVVKLDLKVLPCVVGFVNGVSKMKMVGFDELEGGDNFSTASLELMMLQNDVLAKFPGTQKLSLSQPTSVHPMRRGIKSSSHDDLEDLYD